MARIKIKDLPADHKVSRAEMKQVFGGTSRIFNFTSGIGALSFTTDEFGQAKPNDTDPVLQPMATPGGSRSSYSR